MGRLKRIRTCLKEFMLASLGRNIEADCGHQTKLRGTIGHEGDQRKITLKLGENGHPFSCLACIEKAIIPCAWCGKPIWPDEPITLYLSSNPEQEVSVGSVLYREVGGKKVYVGCLRWDCARTGADRAGFWVVPGEVERCLSPLEEALQSPSGMVIVSDLSDRSTARPIES